METHSDAALREILETTSTIAVVGCSSTPGKAAHDVPRYLLDQGYEIVPVNPFADDIFGRQALDSVDDVEESIDVICCFRPSDEIDGIVDTVIERTDVDVLWLQLGIRNDAAARRAIAAGITVVQDRCMRIEHQRLCKA